MKIVTADQMREIDRRAAASGIATDALMENAGRGVAEAIRSFIDYVAGKTILALAGPGNNGGDALVAARWLHEWGANVTVYLMSGRKGIDKNLSLIAELDIPVFDIEKDVKLMKLKKLVPSSAVVIDGILGTGKARPIEGSFKEILDLISEEKKRRPALVVAAVDIPTGLNADTGAVDPSCLQADLTITLGLPKPGLYNFPGAEKAGKLVIADIGIPDELSGGIQTELMTAVWAGTVLPARPAGANKGTFGRVLAVVGSENYIGAAYLACMGAARVGAGVVTLSTARSLQPILAAKLTEVTYAPLPETEKGTLSGKAAAAILSILPYYRALLIGCGLGQLPHTKSFISSVLSGLPERRPIIILDADALNIVSGMDRWWDRLPADTILTPHAGEMGRLLKISIDEVQGNRLEICRRAAADWNKIVVLKGAFTIVAEPSGRARVSDAANAGLASAGTGDVLAGAIAGLAGQGIPPFDAASLGVYLHAAAGELVKDELGDTGMLASDLLPMLPKVIKGLKV
jgi:NAD(P)H-hydrate epimerase